MNVLLRCLAVVLALSLGGPDHMAHAQSAQDAQGSREEIIDLLGKMPELSGTRERLIKQGFEDDKLALAVDHEKRIVSDRVIAEYIADRLIALYDGNLSAASSPEGLIAPLFDAGFGHLPVSDMAFYYQVQVALLDRMPTRDCGLIVKGRMSDRRLERTVGQAEAQLSAKTLKRYYEVQRKAIRTGVNTGAKTLSPGENARVQEEINKAVRARVEVDPALRKAGSAFDNMQRATPRHACEAGKLFYQVVVDMKGRDLRNALIYLNAL